MFRFKYLLLIVPLAMGFASGCQRGPSLGTVSGTVKVNGQPLPYAYVVFQPIDPPGTYGSAYTDEFGEYSLRFNAHRDGAPVGRHQVSIRAATNEELPDHAHASARVHLPEKYNEQTELLRDVKLGHNEIDFDLESQVVAASR